MTWLLFLIGATAAGIAAYFGLSEGRQAAVGLYVYSLALWTISAPVQP